VLDQLLAAEGSEVRLRVTDVDYEQHRRPLLPSPVPGGWLASQSGRTRRAIGLCSMA
jgi:hypothetical protein